MVLARIELETLVSEPDALTTRPPPSLCFSSNTYHETLTELNELEPDPFYIATCVIERNAKSDWTRERPINQIKIECKIKIFRSLVQSN